MAVDDPGPGTVVVDGSTPWARTGPVAVGGFAFAPQGSAAPHWSGFPSASLHVPEAVLARRDGAVWLTLCALATPDDTANWVERLVEGEVLDPAMQKEMQTGVPVGAANVSYGLGLLMLGAPITGGAGPGLGHGGSINGYHTQAFHFPETKVTIVSIVNQDGTDPNDRIAAALGTLFP